MYSPMTNDDLSPSDLERAAADALATSAARWEPWANGVFAIVAFLLIGDAVLQPIIWSMGSNGWYPMEKALVHARNNVIAALPGYALLWAVWEARAFLAALRRRAIWPSPTQRALTRLGLGLALAGALGLVVNPALSFLHGDFNPHPEITWLALCGVGVLVVMVARMTASVIDVALALKRENEEFI